MRAGELERFSALVEKIYDAALDPESWPPVVEDVVESMQGSCGLLFTPFHNVDSGGFAFPVNVQQTFLQQYASRYQQHDVWTQTCVERGLTASGTVLTGDELVPYEQLCSTTFYREFLAPQDTTRICFSVIFGPEAANVLSTCVSVYRSDRARPFSAATKRWLELLTPHLSRSLGIMLRLRDAEFKVTATLAALDRLPGGVVLVGARRTVVFANDAARRKLAQEDGLRLQVQVKGGPCLAALSSDVQRELDGALDICLGALAGEVPHFVHAVRVKRPSGRAAYAVNVSALPRENEFGAGPDRPLAIVFLGDPADDLKVDHALLARTYGLTAAECRLAAEILSGDSLSAIASRLDVSENTVKSQLQSVFEKTGTNRQVQLVKVLLSLSRAAAPS